LKFSLFIGLLISINTAAKSIDVQVNHYSTSAQHAVVVYLTPHDTKLILPHNSNELIINQQEKMFAPYIAVTQRGSQVAFENKDDITHHIYSVSGKNNFEFKIKSGEVKLSSTLHNVEEVAMGCNIHDWMSGYVLVVDTPYYQKTNQQGLAQFNVAHSGKYTLSVWHPQLDVKDSKIEQVIEVNLNNASRQTWTISLPSALLDIPSQESQDDFDFLDEY